MDTYVQGTQKVRSPRISKVPIIDSHNGSSKPLDVTNAVEGQSSSISQNAKMILPKIQISDRTKKYSESFGPSHRLERGNQSARPINTTAKASDFFQPLSSRKESEVQNYVQMINVSKVTEKSAHRPSKLYDIIAPSSLTKSISWAQPKSVISPTIHRDTSSPIRRDLNTRDLIHRFTLPLENKRKDSADPSEWVESFSKFKTIGNSEKRIRPEDKSQESSKLKGFHSSNVDLPTRAQPYRCPKPMEIGRERLVLIPTSRALLGQAGSRTVPASEERRILPLIGALADHGRLRGAHEAAANALSAREPGRLAMLGRFIDLARSANENSREAAAALESFQCLRSGLEALAQDLRTRQGPRRGSCLGVERGFRGQLEQVVGNATWETIETFMGGFVAAIGRPSSRANSMMSQQDEEEEDSDGDNENGPSLDNQVFLAGSDSDSDDELLHAKVGHSGTNKRRASTQYDQRKSVRNVFETESGDDAVVPVGDDGDSPVVVRIRGPATLATVLEGLKAPGSASALRSLDCAHSGLRCSGMSGLVSLLQTAGRALTSLDLRQNGILEEGCSSLARVLSAAVCPSLSTLLLSDNRIGKGAEAIAAAVHQSCSELRTLSFAGNDLTDAILRRSLGALSGHQSLTDLDLGKNRIGAIACEGFGRFFRSTTSLAVLSCTWGQMRGKSALIFAQSLVLARGLVRLNLSWNGLGDPNVVGAVADLLGSVRCKLEYLDMSHCRMDGRAAHLLAGRLVLNKRLKHLILDGNPLGASGVRRLVSTCMAPNADLERVGSEEDSEIHLSVKDCSISTEASLHIFNPAEPAGHYVLDMSEPYSQSVVESLLRIETLGRGAFDRNTMTLAGKSYALSRHTDLETTPSTPKEGELIFTFEAREVTASSVLGDGMGLPGRVHQRLMKLFAGKEISFETGLDRLGFLQLVISEHSEVKLQQAVELLSHLVNETDRVSFVAQVLNKMVEPGARKTLMDHLSERELQAVRKTIGDSASRFTRRNPTGRYQLELRRKEEREIALELLRIRAKHAVSGESESDQDFTAPALPRLRKNPDRIWRNATLDGKPFPWAPSISLPHSGSLELDFVQLWKPQDVDPDSSKPISETEWASFYSRAESANSPTEIISSIKEILDVSCIFIWQIEKLLNLTHFQHISARDQNSNLARKQLVFDARLELAVITFSRTIDWHGFFGYWGLYRQRYSTVERKWLGWRLGAENAWFDHCMAVDYYHLDMANAEERMVVEELVHLAASEPGENCVDTMLDDIDFVIPSTWTVEVPKKGVLSTFYCREQATIEACYAAAIHKHSGSIPDSQICMPNTTWIDDARLRIVGEKLGLSKFATAEECFHAMDKDRGGTLSRKEIAVGLLQVGVWLRPSILASLMEYMDINMSRDVDLSEFQIFWDKFCIF